MAQQKMLRFLVDGLTRAFDKQEDCDVVFSVNGQTIGAHRLILNIHSEVLYEMASGWTLDKEPIFIDDMSYDSFKALLRYMYSGEMILSNGNVFIFLCASTRFQMNFLEELCVNYITTSLCIENVCTYMKEAVHFNSAILQKKCLEIFSKEMAQVTLGDFKKLSLPALSAVLDVEEIDIVEAALFHRIRLWMEQQCRNRSLPVNGANMRLVIGDALYKIRFPTMTVQDFANSVTTIKGLLTDTEMALVYQKITVFDNEEIECPFPNKFRCNISSLYVPFADMEKLLNEQILFNNTTKQQGDCSSTLKFAKMQRGYKDIGIPMHSFRFVLQCCADLANSSSVAHYASPRNLAIRNELYDEFLAWKDIAKGKNVSDTMNKFMELRTKINKLYRWS